MMLEMRRTFDEMVVQYPDRRADAILETVYTKPWRPSLAGKQE